MSSFQKFLIVMGTALILTGLFWPVISKLGIGRLPGDLILKREGWTVYFPFTSMLLVSILLSAIFRFWGK